MSLNVDKVLSIRWLKPPHELPLRLVLFRIIEAAEGPIAQDEILAVLEHYEVTYESLKVVQNRLSELAEGTYRELMIRRVMNGVFVAIGDE